MATTSTRAIRIINNQIKEYIRDPSRGLTFEQNEYNVFKLFFTFVGPDNTPWEKQKLTGEILFPESYPYDPPKIYFTCPVYHPNIYTDGKVCLSILNKTQDETKYYSKSELWSPVFDIKYMFICINSLFVEPNLESPANLQACIDYRNDKTKFTEMIKTMFITPLHI